MTKISVLIPVYNAENFLHQTIDSILCQTFSDFEVLLLDDASFDKSPEIIKSYSDPRIKYIECSHDFIGTLNRGLDIAIGEYIALLDHDDIMMPKRLEIQYNYMEEHPDIVACGAYMHSFGSYSTVMQAPLKHVDITKEMIIRCPTLNPTGFIRSKILKKNNLKYSRGYSFAADFKFWADIVKLGEVVTIPEILTLYRTYPEQTSVKYRPESYEASLKIQMEILEYFFSLLEKDNIYYPLITEKLLPAIDNLGEEYFFSPNVLYRFMYELIDALLKKNLITLKQ